MTTPGVRKECMILDRHEVIQYSPTELQKWNHGTKVFKRYKSIKCT